MIIITFFFLQMDYNKRDSVYRFVRKPFVLPFLPEEQIPVTFDALSTIAYKLYRDDLDQPNHQRGLYTAWLWGQTTTSRDDTTASTVLPTILRSSDSTTQGDHHIPTQLKMISKGKLRRYQRKTTRLLQCRIYQLWDRCAQRWNYTSVDQLLRECGQIYNSVQWTVI